MKLNIPRHLVFTLSFVCFAGIAADSFGQYHSRSGSTREYRPANVYSQKVFRNSDRNHKHSRHGRARHVVQPQDQKKNRFNKNQIFIDPFFALQLQQPLAYGNGFRGTPQVPTFGGPVFGQSRANFTHSFGSNHVTPTPAFQQPFAVRSSESNQTTAPPINRKSNAVVIQSPYASFADGSERQTERVADTNVDSKSTNEPASPDVQQASGSSE